VEGEPAVVMVKAKGNPDQIKYKWSKNNTPIKNKPKKMFVDGPVLNFTEVSRKDKGKFDCEASNSEGATTITIDLDVQCKIVAESESNSRFNAGLYFRRRIELLLETLDLSLNSFLCDVFWEQINPRSKPQANGLSTVRVTVLTWIVK
jgi:hypothetical protein